MTKRYLHKIFVPYRVCPVGAHIDHQLGITSGFAINQGINMEYSITTDGSFAVSTDSFINEAIFNYTFLPPISGEWYDYLVGSIEALKENYKLKYGLKAHIKY